MANVYIFNATPSQIGLLLNQYPLSPINGVVSSNSYAANSQSVPRNPSPGNPGLAQFGGQNVLVVNFPQGGGLPLSYEVDINSQQNPMTQDLQLYVFFDELVLVSPATGTQTNEGQGQSKSIEGSPATSEQLNMMGGAGGDE